MLLYTITFGHTQMCTTSSSDALNVVKWCGRRKIRGAKMSLLIKGMKMPKDTYVTINIWADGHVYTFGENGENPMMLHNAAVELPDHGRLADVDEMERMFLEATGVSISFNGVPTVIPAERSEASLCDNCDERSDIGCSWCKRMESSEE